jgi:hypothetical protein
MSVLHVTSTHGHGARRTTTLKTSGVPTRMYMEALQVTPVMAAQWLERNVDNRRIRKHKVRQWSIVIRQGRWKLTHQGIALDENGHLLDGQTFPFIGYRNLVLENYPELTPPQGSLLRALNGGLERIDAFARALIAFDPSRSNISKIQIKTYGNAYEAARKYCVAHGLSPELNG